MRAGRGTRRGLVALLLATVLAALTLGVSAASEPSDRGEGSSAEAGAAARSDRGTAGVRIVTRGQAALLRRGRLVMRLRYAHAGRVRVFIRSPRRAARPGRTIALVRGRSFRFREGNARRVSFPLTRRGRRLVLAQLRDCRTIRVIATTRARRYAISSSLPPFARENRARRSRDARRVRRLRPGGSRCGGRDDGRQRGGTPGGGDRDDGRPGSGGGGPGSGGSGGNPGGGNPSGDPGGGDPGGGDPGGGDPDPDLLRAGAAESDITPPIGTPMFAYTSRSLIANPENLATLPDTVVADPGTDLHAKTFVPSEGIHTRVNARALVLERDGEKLALVQTDLGGVPYALVQEVTDRIESTGITLDRMMLSATHTHASTGPIWPPDSAGYGVLGGDLFDPRIFDLTAEGIAESILAADAKLERARLGVATTEVRDASRNRNFDIPFRANEDVPEDEAAARAASIDPDLSVVRVDALDDGAPLAVWSNFAIHPTSFGGDNLLFSGDNAGFSARIAEQAIEDEAGGSDVVNVWTNGNEGDISPDGGADRGPEGEPLQYVPNSFGSAHMAGLKVARGTVRAWRAAGEEMTRAPELSVERSLLDFDGTPADGEPVGPLPELGQGGITAPDGTCAPAGEGRPIQGRKVPAATGPLAPNQASVSVARIGPLGVAAFPLEITRQMGKRIRDQALSVTGGAVDRIALAGMTNGYLSYTSTPEEYDTCHYEGSFTLFGEHQGPRLRDFAEGLSVALFQDGAGPAAGSEPAPTGFTVDELAPEETPEAGTAIVQPAGSVARLGRATFSWFGGDPKIDAPRNADFVTLEREVAPGEWVAAGTDEGFRDTTRRGMGDSWEETWQFDECDPLGTYRFSVEGVADKGEGPAPYELTSDEFTLGPLAGVQLGTVAVSGGEARVRATYPDPGPDALLALPRFLRTGTATLAVNGREVEAEPDPDSPDFVADVPPNAQVTATSVSDACGNGTTAP